MFPTIDRILMAENRSFSASGGDVSAVHLALLFTSVSVSIVETLGFDEKITDTPAEPADISH